MQLKCNGWRSFGLGVFAMLSGISACTSRGFNSKIADTLEFSEDSRKQAIADADTWGEPWVPGEQTAEQTAEQIAKSDAKDLAKISARNTLVGPWDTKLNPESSPLDGPLKWDCTFDTSVADPKDPPGGKTAKWYCNVKNGGVENKKSWKIKYDPAYNAVAATPDVNPNHGLYGEIIGTRLLWALGFLADKLYPVEATCQDCPTDPWLWIRAKAGILDPVKDSSIGHVSKSLYVSGKWENAAAPRIYFPAVTESKSKGDTIQVPSHRDKNGRLVGDVIGWGFGEIFRSDSFSKIPAKAKRQRMHREAYTMLAAFLHHADNKSENQRIVCLDKVAEENETGPIRERCNRPYLMIHDPGNLLGTGWTPLANVLKGASPTATTKLKLEDWSNFSTWKQGDSRNCVVKVNGHFNGTLNEQAVSKEGADFLKALMSRLTDSQITGIFEAGMVELAPGGSKRVVIEGTNYRIVNRDEGGRTVSDWVRAFKFKMQRDIFEHQCGK